MYRLVRHVDLAVQKLKDDGYDVETVEFHSPETLSQAIAGGEVDIATSSAGTIFSAIDAGADIKTFLGELKPDYVMVTKKGTDTCEELDGGRVGIHSREGTTDSLVAQWLRPMSVTT